MFEIKYAVDDKAHKLLDEWLLEQDRLAIEIQKANNPNPHGEYIMCWEEGIPYTGAIGGCCTYKICYTSLGAIFTVEHGITKNTIDLTEYDNW